MLAISTLWRTWRKELGPDQKLLAAVSGGADSVALLHLILPPKQERSRLIIGYVHHGTGPFADESEALVKKLANELSTHIVTRHITISEDAKRQLGFEAAAREKRYSALEEIAEEEGCSLLMTGHTLDDQAESFLLAALRGGGMGGLSGVRSQRGKWRRPLLSMRHEELCNFLRDNDIQWMEDPANEDQTYTRVAIRKKLHPLITSEFGEGAWENIAHSTGIIAETEEMLEGLTGAWLREVDRGSTQKWISVDAPALLGYFANKRDRVLIAAYFHAIGSEDEDMYLDRSARKLLRNALRGKSGDCFRLGEVFLRRTENRLIFDGVSASPTITLPLPGSVKLPDGGGFNVELLDVSRMNEQPAVPGFLEYLDADRLGKRVLLRPWQEGDRFDPLGRPGSQVKVTRALRRKSGERTGILWVLQKEDGSIAFVGGERIADPFKVRQETVTVARVTFTPPSNGMVE